MDSSLRRTRGSSLQEEAEKLLEIARTRILVRYVAGRVPASPLVFDAELLAVKGGQIICFGCGISIERGEITYIGTGLTFSDQPAEFMIQRLFGWGHETIAWCQPKEFVGLVSLDSKTYLEFEATSHYFQFHHGYLLGEVNNMEEHAPPSIFYDGIVSRFDAFLGKIQTKVAKELFGSTFGN